MLIEKPLPFVTTFIEALNDAIKIHQPGSELSRTQKYWLSFCVMAILITSSVCWARFERASIGKGGIVTGSLCVQGGIVTGSLCVQKIIGTSKRILSKVCKKTDLATK